MRAAVSTAAVRGTRSTADAGRTTGAGCVGALMGPNAIIQMGEALRQLCDDGVCRSVFLRAGLFPHLLDPPQKMVAETDVVALHQALKETVPPNVYGSVSWRAGELTGDYILTHRIPRAVQVVLRVLPRWMAARVLASAIERHAWTFAGSGTFRVIRTNPPVLELAGGLLSQASPHSGCRCTYYAGTFTLLFSRLVDPDWRFTELQCSGEGAQACVFMAVSGMSD